MRVQRRKYRFRIINASNARFYSFSLDNGLHFVQIGSDSFYLERPISLKRILVAPSEIIDVIIDFSKSKSRHIVLENSANFPYPDGDSVDDINKKVMKFIVGKRHLKDNAKVPSKLAQVEKLKITKETKTRSIVLYEFDSFTGEPTHLLINFKQFTDPVTEQPKNGTTEVWQIINLTPDNHPFHVHLAGFQVLGQQKIKNLDELSECVVQHNNVEPCQIEKYLDGVPEPPPPNEAGWKNVFKMKPSYVTTIILRFALPSGQPFPFDPTGEPGYTYHCHVSPRLSFSLYNFWFYAVKRKVN